MDGRLYKLHMNQVDWHRANHICTTEGARLAIVDSNRTLQYIMKSFNQYVIGIWLGARDMNSTNNWKWIDGVEVDNTYWVAGQPTKHLDVQEDNCAMIMDYSGLQDVPCSSKQPLFLCQKGI